MMIYAAVALIAIGFIIGAVAERLHWFWLARKGQPDLFKWMDLQEEINREIAIELAKEGERSMNSDTRIKLGMKIKDKLSGLEGTCIGYTYWLYGCERVTIQPFGVHEGKPHDSYTIDEPQAEVLDEKPVVKPATTPRHGPRADAPRR